MTLDEFLSKYKVDRADKEKLKDFTMIWENQERNKKEFKQYCDDNNYDISNLNDIGICELVEMWLEWEKKLTPEQFKHQLYFVTTGRIHPEIIEAISQNNLVIKI